MIHCTSCGQSLGDGAIFCSSCGAKQAPSTPQAIRLASEALPPPTGLPVAITPDEQEQWTSFARTIFLDVIENGGYTGPQPPVPFVPQFAADERRIAVAHCTLYTFGGLDAGESALNPLAAAGFTIAAPVIGLGYVLGSAITNHRARQAAVPQWRFDSQGTMTMADHGIYFPNPATGVAIPVSYSVCTSCVLTHPNRIEMDLQNDGEAIKMAVVSPAAVVVFMLWCLTVYPTHPQLKGILGIR